MTKALLDDLQGDTGFKRGGRVAVPQIVQANRWKLCDLRQAHSAMSGHVVRACHPISPSDASMSPDKETGD
jgi:hypothetical protein